MKRHKIKSSVSYHGIKFKEQKFILKFFFLKSWSAAGCPDFCWKTVHLRSHVGLVASAWQRNTSSRCRTQSRTISLRTSPPWKH